jgi:hypothetical protein
MCLNKMAVSENFVGRNYWGLTQQDGPWRMTSQDYNNRIDRPIVPGPAGNGSKSYRRDDQTISFKDRFSTKGDVTVPESRYSQFSIVTRRGQSMVPAPNGYGSVFGTRGYDSNQKSKDIGDVQDFLDMEANAFGASLGSEFYDKPLYPKGGNFITEGYLRDQAIKQLIAPTVQLKEYEQRALAEDFYDHMVSGVAPLGKVNVKTQRLGPNLLVSDIRGPFESEYNEHFIPSRMSLMEQAMDTHQHLQAREDYLLDRFQNLHTRAEGEMEQELDQSQVSPQ